MQFSEGTPIDLSVITIVIQLIFLEGILSIDNAAVLGAMVSVLPDREPVPYPRFLKFLQPATNRFLGMQRSAALKAGLLGAYIGRGLMLFLATYVIQNPWLRLIGAFYLIKLAFEHLPGYALGTVGHEHEDSPALASSNNVSFWGVVLQVELADLAFSLDNVVAAVALSDQYWVVMLGVALGIVTMRFAAGIFTHLIQREPILAPAAYLLVLNIGVELILEDFHLYEFNEWSKFVISLSTLAIALIYAHSPFLQHLFRPLVIWVARGMTVINTAINWLFRPLGWTLKTSLRGVGYLMKAVVGRRSTQSSAETGISHGGESEAVHDTHISEAATASSPTSGALPSQQAPDGRPTQTADEGLASSQVR